MRALSQCSKQSGTSRRISLGLIIPKHSLCNISLVLYNTNLALKGRFQFVWPDAEDKFRYIWEKRRDGLKYETKKQATIASLRAGHQLGLCLAKRKCHQLAVNMLEE